MSEVRPIDANALEDKIIQECRLDLNDYEVIKYCVDEMPTLDYEPVVRCKDCKHRNKEYGPMFCQVLGRNTKDNFYCRYGAKMDEEVKG